jgi:hypothetical protein
MDRPSLPDDAADILERRVHYNSFTDPDEVNRQGSP